MLIHIAHLVQPVNKSNALHYISVRGTSVESPPALTMEAIDNWRRERAAGAPPAAAGAIVVSFSNPLALGREPVCCYCSVFVGYLACY